MCSETQFTLGGMVRSHLSSHKVLHFQEPSDTYMVMLRSYITFLDRGWIQHVTDCLQKT